MNQEIALLASQINGRVTEIRHDLHRHPEIAYDEHRTAGAIETFLDEIGVAHSRLAGTGVVATIGGEGRTVALRSEMDALPMDDRSGLPYASEYPGRAHACGHEGHMAILLGTAWVLNRLASELAGAVKLIWQPAEEGGAGAKKMIDAGALADPAPELIFALHGWPGLPVGRFGCRFGSAMAAVDNFEIVVNGRGAHAAMPQNGVDPIMIAARIVEGIQLVRSRMLDPIAPAVVTVATIHGGGTAYNIIPDTATLSGTIRTLDPTTRAAVPEMLERMAIHTAEASGGNASFTLLDGYPPTINDRQATAFAQRTLSGIFGPDAVWEIPEPVMGGEDFAYYLEHIPGSFIRLGVGDRPSLHSSQYDFNDEAIVYGIRAMAGMASAYLNDGL